MHSRNNISKCLTQLYSCFSKVSSPIHTLHTAISHVIIVMKWQFLSHAVTIEFMSTALITRSVQCANGTRRPVTTLLFAKPPLLISLNFPDTTFSHAPWHVWFWCSKRFTFKRAVLVFIKRSCWFDCKTLLTIAPCSSDRRRRRAWWRVDHSKESRGGWLLRMCIHGYGMSCRSQPVPVG